MTKLKAALLVLAWLSVAYPASVRANDIQVMDGACTADSHTAEGPIGSDLRKRHSRFYCDSASITVFDNNPKHVLLQFVDKRSHHPNTIGFGGVIGDDGFLAIGRVYFGSTGIPSTPNENYWKCKFGFTGHAMSIIACGVGVDEEGQRTTALVVFNPTSHVGN